MTQSLAFLAVIAAFSLLFCAAALLSVVGVFFRAIIQRVNPIKAVSQFMADIR